MIKGDQSYCFMLFADDMGTMQHEQKCDIPYLVKVAMTDGGFRIRGRRRNA